MDSHWEENAGEVFGMLCEKQLGRKQLDERREASLRAIDDCLFLPLPR